MKRPTIPQMAMTSRSCQAHGLVPGGRLNDASTAVMRWRTWKYPETLASVVPGLIGNYSPENASKRKKTMLIIGPRGVRVGTRVLIPTPNAVKLSIPTTMVRTKANGWVGR